jgi:hypothetical protein
MPHKAQLTIERNGKLWKNVPNVKKQKPKRVSGEATFPDIMMLKYNTISAPNAQCYLSPGFTTFMKTPFTTIEILKKTMEQPSIND